MTDPKSVPADDQAPLSDTELTRKDRSYSPSSDRETEQKQRDAVPADGVKQLPGTGGPDDAGDVDIPDDHIDASVIVERSTTGHRPGDA
jgi:hypothetical protein